MVGMVLLSVAGTLLAVVLLTRSVVLWHDRALRRMRRQVAGVVARDATPAFTTDADGRIHYQNAAADTKFGAEGQTLLRRLEGLFAHPSSTLYRLQHQASQTGAAREDVATRNGTARLSVHAIPGGFLWRFEETPGAELSARTAEDVALPRLIVNRSGTVLAVNRALRRALGHEIAHWSELAARPPRSGEVITVPQLGPVLLAVTEAAAGRHEVYMLPGVEGARPVPGHDGLGFEDLPVGLLRIGHGGEILAANRLARELLAADPGPEDRLADLVEGLGRPVGDWLSDAFAGRTLGRPEVVRASRPQSEIFLQVTLRRVHPAEGESEPALFALLHDATELKTLEAQFVQSQKMHAIGQLAGGIAHDFNNLLTAISGHCDLLLLRHDRNDPDYGDLVQIHQNANRAASLVGQLLAFSRKQTLQPQLIDLRDALADLGHLLNRLVGGRVRLVVSRPAELDLIRADPRQLEQVLMNLVVNARDAMPEGGEITIEARNESLDCALTRDRAVIPPGRYVVLRVTDQGIGIPPDKMPKIFEPFFTTKRAGEGTGLGLSTAYGIVKQTGGFIFADSTPGEGTTFTLYLPAHSGIPQVTSVTGAETAATSLLTPGHGVVLLVEDEAPVRAFASRALRLRGYTVLEAESAEEALAILANPEVTVDIFVSDVIMPGKGGPAWVREALQARPGVKVVFMSGYAEDSFPEAQARIPNSVFLQKPFSLAELTATVQAQLER
ncbi:ATP-binding protein [Plastorhodobacter daqingensis]|uniref:histidine kinase n=1 Tax=Plastorhodobacter daqingensis TaxID=1387281 RepID=A0ABW2UPL9_9RHOB